MRRGLPFKTFFKAKLKKSEAAFLKRNDAGSTVSVTTKLISDAAVAFRKDIKRQRAIGSVRVKGGKSLRNGMWHGVRSGIIMRNTIYAGNKLTEERITLSSRQFYKSSSFFDVADY